MLYLITAQGVAEHADDVRALFEELVRGQRSIEGVGMASLATVADDGQATLYHDTDVPELPAEVEDEEAGEAGEEEPA
jgi:hypothetical protein